MSETAIILTSLICLALIIWLISLFISFFSILANIFFKDYANQQLLFRKLKPRYNEILKHHSEYYKRLSYRDQKVFRRRVQKFIDMKKFIPRGDLAKVTDEMKVLIAATAIQITFGFPGIYFEHFGRILLYKSNYYSKITQQYHRGEVNMRGFIVLSWDSFEYGFNDNSDGINLGFHEMAHALRLENALFNNEYNFLDLDLLKEFTFRAKRESKKIKDGGPSFFRKYAAVNSHEFFAIAIENFFERPKGFKKYDSALYELTAKIIKQDPLAPALKQRN